MRVVIPASALVLAASIAVVASEDAVPLVSAEKTAPADSTSPQRRLRSNGCYGSGFGDYYDCQGDGYSTGGTYDRYEKDYFDASTTAFVDQLHQDAESFVVQVRDWLRSITYDWGVGVDTTFSLSTHGPVDLQQPCGGVPLRAALPVIQRFIQNPVDARLDIDTIRPVFWRPSSECFHRYGAVDVDGGAHATIELKCGRRVLLNASIAMGGTASKSFWRRSEASGVAVSVALWDGAVRVVRAAGMLNGTVTEVSAPVSSRYAVYQWMNDVRACKTSEQLVLRGVAGGGWSQRHSNLPSFGGSFKPSIVGYADAFELAYPAPNLTSVFNATNLTALPWAPSLPNGTTDHWLPSLPNATALNGTIVWWLPVQVNGSDAPAWLPVFSNASGQFPSTVNATVLPWHPVWLLSNALWGHDEAGLSVASLSSPSPSPSQSDATLVQTTPSFAAPQPAPKTAKKSKPIASSAKQPLAPLAFVLVSALHKLIDHDAVQRQRCHRQGRENAALRAFCEQAMRDTSIMDMKLLVEMLDLFQVSGISQAQLTAVTTRLLETRNHSALIKLAQSFRRMAAWDVVAIMRAMIASKDWGSAEIVARTLEDDDEMKRKMSLTVAALALDLDADLRTDAFYSACETKFPDIETLYNRDALMKLIEKQRWTLALSFTLYNRDALMKLIEKQRWTLALSFVGSDSALQSTLLYHMVAAGEHDHATFLARERLGIVDFDVLNMASTLEKPSHIHASLETLPLHGYLELPLQCDSDVVFCTSEQELQEVIAHLEIGSETTPQVIGLDVEWRPTSTKIATTTGVTSTAAVTSILQVASESRVFLIDLLELHTSKFLFDRVLAPLFQSPALLKVGFGFDSDLKAEQSSGSDNTLHLIPMEELEVLLTPPTDGTSSPRGAKHIAVNSICFFADAEQRIVLTRDKKLADRRDAGACFVVSTDDPFQQFAEIRAHFEIPIDRDEMMTRCARCNAKQLELVDRAFVERQTEDVVHPHVLETTSEFWHCVACHKIFWEGPKFNSAIEFVQALGISTDADTSRQ
ncbi:hypothetical protein P43SY_005999 [Pythium insidiosum]|uniref:Mut7-C RNAse domain-containing protein n=1 Tax=Pythium insidiosum TaxID=114742 RepID=A0AAD5QB49_PYTIN|nr:hypothetical protein P43SY_005999 [Pythium insidiosum]